MEVPFYSLMEETTTSSGRNIERYLEDTMLLHEETSQATKIYPTGWKIPQLASWKPWTVDRFVIFLANEASIQ